MAAKNVLLVNGGGPTAVINLTNMGLVEGVLDFSDESVEIYGAFAGTGSLVGEHATLDGKRKILRLTDVVRDSNQRQLIKNTPSTWLGSGRYKPGAAVPDDISGGDAQQAADYDCARIIQACDDFHIHHVFFVGGDDTLLAINALIDYSSRHPGREYPTFISVPKTIDDDLPYAIEDPEPDEARVGEIHQDGRIMVIDASPGYGTAAQFVATNTAHVAVEARALDRHYVIEVMGRDAGFLAASTLLARPFGYGPHLIAVPEHGPFDMDAFAEFVLHQQAKQGFGVYVVSEGIRDATGNPLTSGERMRDAFGNIALGGAARTLVDRAQRMAKARGIKAEVRHIRYGELQRVSANCRSSADAEIAYKVGYRAAYWGIVRAQTGKLVTIVREDSQPPSWQYGLVPTRFVSGKQHKRTMDPAWVVTADVDGHKVQMIDESFHDYLDPLVDPLTPIAQCLPYGEILVS